jgi:hypothetical protein
MNTMFMSGHCILLQCIELAEMVRDHSGRQAVDDCSVTSSSCFSLEFTVLFSRWSPVSWPVTFSSDRSVPAFLRLYLYTLNLDSPSVVMYYSYSLMSLLI